MAQQVHAPEREPADERVDVLDEALGGIVAGPITLPMPAQVGGKDAEVVREPRRDGVPRVRGEREGRQEDQRGRIRTPPLPVMHPQAADSDELIPSLGTRCHGMHPQLRPAAGEPHVRGEAHIDRAPSLSILGGGDAGSRRSPLARREGIMGTSTRGEAGDMATFVLVHAACHGGWSWRRVTPLLRAAGHEAYTPTLTGLGERAHLLSPDIDLDTHIQDVANVLHYEDLGEVILVGHSYAGMVITGVADRARPRVGHLVYLDTVIPGDGQSLYDLRGRRAGEGTGPIRPPSPHYLGVTAEDDARWVASRLTPHPGTTFEQKLRLSDPAVVSRMGRTFIRCTEFGAPGGPLDAAAERARTEPGWRYREMTTGHSPNITHPQRFADLLLEVVQQS